MNFIENTGVVVSTNLGETRESQIANGVSHVDPEAWEAKRYELGDDVLGSDGNVYRYIANNNAIPCKNRGAMDSEFETLDELVDRIRYAYDADVSAGASSGSSTLKTATLSIDLGDKPNPSGYGTFTGQVLVRGNPSWNGGFTFENRLGGIFTSQATIISGQGTDLQLWDLGELDVFFNGQMPTSFFSYLLKLVFNSLNGNASFTLQNSKINYRQPLADAEADLYGYQNPVGADIPTERGFIGDIDWWVLIRANAHNSFFDEKPAVGIGRRGAVQVQVSSETHFDSVALVNCECLEAEVAGNMLQSCQVQGVDNTGNFNTTLFLTLTCIGNAPTSGTGLLDGVITLRSDTKFTWDGIPNQVNNPAILQATRMPNDGANDAMVQRWIVKGAVYDFTRVGEIFIDNAIGETNFTGSFEGMVSYEGNTTITLSPDAPHEPSDLLFTDLQLIQQGGIERLCEVQGVDTTPNNTDISLILSLTCEGNTPNTGTASLDGVITLNSDTNFTWDGLANIFGNPANLVATRMPNDGADNAMVQHWIVKGAVFDFTKSGFIGIPNAIGETNFTGSFEGELTRDTGQPIAYTATINIKADEADIPTASQTASGRQTASIGQIVIGMDKKIGITTSDNINKSLLDFSKVERTTEGDFIVFPRHATYEIDCRVKYAVAKGQKVQRMIHNITPAVPAFFYVPDRDATKTTDFPNGNLLGAGMYLYGIIETANFGVDTNNDPTNPSNEFDGNENSNGWGEFVDLKISGLV